MTRPLTPEEHEIVNHVFTYHPPSADAVEAYTLIREGAKSLAQILIVTCPNCADRSAALRKLREVVMTANASIALNGKAF